MVSVTAPATIAVRPASARDAAAIKSLLDHAGLPTADLDGSAERRLWVAEDAGQPIGAIGLEPCGTTGLLRSLVVAPSHRSRGVGQALVGALEAAARRAGLESLVLLTQTAETFFRRRGYAVVDRASVPEAVKSTTEFRSLCPASAVCMRKSLA